MIRTSTTARKYKPQKAQGGIVLLIALIMLVVLTLSGIALFRQTTTGVLIASNLTFKNAALSASDRGVEAARTWLVGASVNLQQPSIANGYFPAWCNTVINAANVPDADNNGITDDCKSTPPPSQFDPLVYNWANSALVTNDDGNGNSVRYVIHRLCRIAGGLSFTNDQGIPQECVTVGTASTGSSKGAVSYGSRPISNTIAPYYRITTRTTGPRNTVVYSQVIMY